MTNVNTTINQLPPVVGALSGSEIIPLDQAGTTKKATVQNIVRSGIQSGFPASIEYVIDGGGAAITSPFVKGYLTVPFGCTITSFTVTADRSGSAVLDIWKCTIDQFDAGVTAPTSANSITGSSQPTLSATSKAQSSQLQGWTTTLNSSDVIAYYVQSATTVQRITVSLYCSRSFT